MSSHANVTLCIPVLRRYDLLERLILSLHRSTVYPRTISIVDNGGFWSQTLAALQSVRAESNRVILCPSHNLGVAASWNHFIQTTLEPRIISNDDILFQPDSLEKMLDAAGDIVSCVDGNLFSCFLFRDTAKEKVGLFDETISPNYAYFEDCDYEERMAGKLEITMVDCGVVHGKSKTLEGLSKAEMNEHHRRFLIARENFRRKWGRLPRGAA